MNKHETGSIGAGVGFRLRSSHITFFVIALGMAGLSLVAQKLDGTDPESRLYFWCFDSRPTSVEIPLINARSR
jgi:hypothetical protein